MWLPHVDSDLQHSLTWTWLSQQILCHWSKKVMLWGEFLVLSLAVQFFYQSFTETALICSKAFLDAFKSGAFLRDAVWWFPRDQSQSNNPSHPLETEHLLGKHNNGSTGTDVTLGNCLAHFSVFQLREGATTKQISLQTNVQEQWVKVLLFQVFSQLNQPSFFITVRNPMLLQVLSGFFVNTGAVQERPWWKHRSPDHAAASGLPKSKGASLQDMDNASATGG